MSDNDSREAPQVSPLLPVAEAVALTVTAVMLSAVAIVGNGVLIFVVMRTPSLHTCTNFFIASLSAGELLMGVFVIPFAGTSALAGSWVFSRGLCRLVGFMGVLGHCASAVSLLVVSADRCVAISKPLRYATLVTKTSTVVVISMVWGYSLLVSVLPLLRWGQYRYSDRFQTCLMRNSATDSAGGVSEVLVKETLCVFLPAALTIVIVIRTVQHIRGHRRVFVFVPLPVSATSLPAGSNNVSNASKSRVKAMRTLFVVSAAFILLCLPLAVADLSCPRPLTSCSVTAPALRALLWLSFHSAVINPIIIMTLNRKFRSKLRSLFCPARGRGKCGPLQLGGDAREVFTITLGLQAVLDTSLVVNVVHGNRQLDATIRRHVILTLRSRGTAAEDPVDQPSRSGRVSVVALRKTHSAPDCRVLQAGRTKSNSVQLT